MLGSVLLVPDTLTSIQTGEVRMSKSYLGLKGLIIANNIQYSCAIGYMYGWYASLYVGVSTVINGCCLSVLCFVKYREKDDIFIEL